MRQVDLVREAMRQYHEARSTFIELGRRTFHAERDPTDDEIDALAMLALKAAAAKTAGEMIAESIDERTGKAN